MGGGFVYDAAGANVAFSSALRALGALSVTALLALTVPVAELLDVLRRLRVPEASLDLLHVTYRSLFVLDDASNRILRAQRNRAGYGRKSGALSTVALALSALFRHTLHRSERWERGLAARCYDGRLTVLTAKTKTRWRHRFLALLLPTVIALAAWLFRSKGIVIG
ncbi:MAG: energy-coupling factor transporter transmembrane component T [Polyangiaceae bacterium]